ncbi:MAG: beta strand repeat-containing protein [Akkermansiaceae bacterium]
MKTRYNPFIRLTSIALLWSALSHVSSAATYRWDGDTDTSWSTVANWATGSGLTAGPAPTAVTAGHRLEVNNGINNPLVYTAAQGVTNYGSATVRGLVVGSSTSSGTMTITGGTFSSFNAAGTQLDVIGNGDNNIGILNISGGTFVGASVGTTLGLGGGAGRVSTLNVNSGSATTAALTFNSTNGTVNLNGGTLSVNNVVNTSIAGINSTFNFNGGTLRARQNTTGFLNSVAFGTARANVRDGGAIIDTNGFNVTISQALTHSNIINDQVTDGGLTKNGTGKLTLSAAPSYTGATVINAGTLSLAPTAPATFSSNISGAGAFEIGGTGRVTLTGNHTHTGGTAVINGASLGGEGSVAGSLSFTGTSSMAFDPSTMGANQHFRANTIDASAGTVSIVPSSSASGTNIVVMEATGGITGVVGLNFLGNSRLSLSFNENNTQLLATYTPASLKWKGTNVANPTFWDTGVTSNWENGGEVDTFAAGDNVLFDDTASNFNVAVQTPIIPGNLTFNHTSNYILSGAAIGGTGNLSKSGSGSLTINTSNTYTGVTNISGGYVILGSNTSLGSADSGTVVSGTGSLDIAGRNLGTEVITISGSGNDSIGGVNQGALVNSGAVQNNAIGRLVLAGDATIGGTSRWDIKNTSPTIDMGEFTLTKYGSGYIGLVGVAVSNPGDIDVTEGVLSIQTSTTMGGTAANRMRIRSNAVLSTWQSANPIVWSIDMENLSTLRAESAAIAANNTWTGPVNIADGGSVTIDAAGSMTLSGVISGTGSAINKIGTGVTYLPGANTYSGLTTIAAGGFVLQNTSALGTTDAGTVVTAGGRVELDNLTISGESLTIAGDGGNFFGALQARSGIGTWTAGLTVTATNTRIGAQVGATLQIPGVISSTSNHAILFRPADLTSTVVLSGANTYTGSTAIAGGVVSISNIGSVGGGASNFGDSSNATDGTIHMSINGATGYLRYTGTGEVTNRVVNLFAATNGAFIDQSGSGLLKFTGDFTATGAGSKNLALLGSTAGVGEIAGAIVDNSATNTSRITKEGTGTWILSGNNTFTGSVTINNGVLVITNSNALGAGVKTVTINASADKWLELDGTQSNITLPADFTFFTSGANGAIRSVAGNNVINGSITMMIGNGNTRIISDNAGSLTVNGNVTANTSGRALDLAGNSQANNVFAGVLDNANVPQLLKSGTGTWTLTAANTYTGATTINGGVLAIGATGSINSSASLSIAAGAELDTTAQASYTLPAAVTIGLHGDSNSRGVIDATGQALDIDGATVVFNISGTLTAPAYVIANYGSLSGSPAFASVTAPSGYEVVYNYNGGTQIALVQSGSDYDDWMDLYPSITGENRLPGADPDADGLSNHAEYAFGLDPSSASSVNPISQALSKSTGVFKYKRRATPARTGVSYSYESSTTLSGAWPVFTPTAEVSNNATPVEEITVTLPAELLQNPQLFIRVRAVKP